MEEEEPRAEEKKETDKKQPDDDQMYSALSFAIILLIFGIPLWWKTTEVYQVSFPYAEIEQLKELQYVVNMTVKVVCIDSVKSHDLSDKLGYYAQSSRLYNIKFKQGEFNKEIIGRSKTLEEIDESISHSKTSGDIQLMEIPGLVRFTSHPILFGQSRTIYFSSDVTVVQLYNFLQKYILKDSILLNLDAHIQEPIHHTLDVDSRRRIPPSDSFDILFTVLNPEPEKLNISIDIPGAIQEYIEPLLKKLSLLNDFHVKSQWLYFVNLPVKPKFVDSSQHGPHYALSQELLAHVITPLEKKLASHVSQNPCLNFVLWVPPCKLAPLHVYSNSGHKVQGADAFLSPQWGGLQIYNPDRQSCQSAGVASLKPNMKQIMSVFLQQLRLLLGVTSPVDETLVVVGKPGHATDWEIDNLIRIRTIEQLSSAKLTLQSLAQLLGVINNIVINDEVGQAIYLALDTLHKSAQALKHGQLSAAYEYSRISFLSSEKAFTHPTLLALLYFPDDQKYAVYIPLFLPVMIPVLISFRILKNWLVSKFKKSEAIKPKTD